MKTVVSILSIMLLHSLLNTAHTQVLSNAQLRMTHLEIAAGGGSFSEAHWNDSLNKPSKIDRFGFSEFGLALTMPVFTHLRCRAAFGVTSLARRVLEIQVGDGTSGPIWYVTPVLGLDTEGIDADIGYVIFLNRKAAAQPRTGMPCAMIRIGSPNEGHLSMSFAHNLPIFSGGGVFDLGAGFKLGDKNMGWAGFCMNPYQNLSLSFKIAGPADEDVFFDGRAQIGISRFDAVEFGIAVGLKLLI